MTFGRIVAVTYNTNQTYVRDDSIVVFAIPEKLEKERAPSLHLYFPAGFPRLDAFKPNNVVFYIFKDNKDVTNIPIDWEAKPRSLVITPKNVDLIPGTYFFEIQKLLTPFSYGKVGDFCLYSVSKKTAASNELKVDFVTDRIGDLYINPVLQEKTTPIDVIYQGKKEGFISLKRGTISSKIVIAPGNNEVKITFSLLLIRKLYHNRHISFLS